MQTRFIQFFLRGCCFLLIFSISFPISSKESFVKKEWSEAHITLLVPQSWYTLFEQTEDFPIFHLSPEPFDSSSANYQVGLAINILRSVPSIMGQKPSEYADNLINQIRERSDQEISVRMMQSSPFKRYRVEYLLLAENESMDVTNILEANDATGTLYMIIWQAPQSQAASFSEVREKILTSIKLDPTF